jgi:hypothetical protein
MRREEEGGGGRRREEGGDPYGPYSQTSPGLAGGRRGRGGGRREENLKKGGGRGSLPNLPDLPQDETFSIAQALLYKGHEEPASRENVQKFTSVFPLYWFYMVKNFFEFPFLNKEIGVVYAVYEKYVKLFIGF